jgi:sRNA-binding protein
MRFPLKLKRGRKPADDYKAAMQQQFVLYGSGEGSDRVADLAVRNPGGELDARHLVHAANCYTAMLETMNNAIRLLERNPRRDVARAREELLMCVAQCTARHRIPRKRRKAARLVTQE